MKQIRLSVSEILYFTYFLVLFGSRSIGIHEGYGIYKFILVAGMALYLVKEAVTCKTVAEHMISLLCLGLAGIVYVNSGEKGILLYVTMMLGIKCVSKDRVFKLGLGILCIAMPVMAVLAMTGLKEQHHLVFTERFLVGATHRYSWGYPGPNVAHTTFIVLAVLFMLSFDGLTAVQRLCAVVWFGLLSLYVYTYTVSYTGLIGCVVLLGTYIYWNFRSRTNLLERGGLVLLYPVLCGISVGVPLLTPEKLFWKLDELMHWRMNYSRYYLKLYPFSWLGQRVAQGPMEDYYIDSAYIYSYVYLGMIPFLLLTGLFIWLVVDCIRNDRRTELAVIMCFSILGLSDPFLYNLAYKNVLFILYGELIYRTLRQVKWAQTGFWGKEIVLPTSRWGDREIVISGRRMEKLLDRKTRVCRYLGAHCVRITAGTIAISTAVLCFLRYVFGVQYIEGRIDMPDEWSLFQRYINISFVTAAVFVGIIEYSRSKSKKTKHNL